MARGDLNSLATQSKTVSLNTEDIKWQYGVFSEEAKWVHKLNNVGTYETLPQICSLLACRVAATGLASTLRGAPDNTQ